MTISVLSILLNPTFAPKFQNDKEQSPEVKKYRLWQLLPHRWPLRYRKRRNRHDRCRTSRQNH